MREKKKSFCHDCLEPFESTQLWTTTLYADGKGGPTHTVGLCKKCITLRDNIEEPNETVYEFNKRLSKYLKL